MPVFLTWWFIIARRHMIQTWTSSRASPMFSFCVYLEMPLEALMVLERLRLFIESLASPESRLELFSLFNSCSLLVNKHQTALKQIFSLVLLTYSSFPQTFTKWIIAFIEKGHDFGTPQKYAIFIYCIRIMCSKFPLDVFTGSELRVKK